MVGPSDVPTYRVEKRAAVLLDRINEVRAIADEDKESLSILTPAAYRDAIVQRRLFGMLSGNEIVGFLVFGGVYPHARIFQIAVRRDHRLAGIANALIRELVSQLEKTGYLSILAAVAEELKAAHALYERNGFTARRLRPGGQARNRTIVVRVRDLETPNLLSELQPTKGDETTPFTLKLRERDGLAPLHAIDLNVLFDLTKGTRAPDRAEAASRLFGAALNHSIRLVVAREFVAELTRTTSGLASDPLLPLARSLPRLPHIIEEEVAELASDIHQMVFVARGQSGAGKPQAISDARHLAEAALAGAASYITSDEKLLLAREELLWRLKIDVVSLNEAAQLLPEAELEGASHARGKGFDVRPSSSSEIGQYLRLHGVENSLIQAYAPAKPSQGWRGTAIVEAGEVVGVSVVLLPQSIDAPTRLLTHIRPDHVACEMFAGHLLDTDLQAASATATAVVELETIPGQSTVRQAAKLRGFLQGEVQQRLMKVAIGRPLTARNWGELCTQVRRRTGIQMVQATTSEQGSLAHVSLKMPNAQSVAVQPLELERIFGPTLFVWAGRKGAIVPIARSYADDLLGTSPQLSMLGRPEASFQARRTYVNSPRTPEATRPGTPILFYESKRSGGRGAIVAAARVVDVLVCPKESVPQELLRRAVVEDINPLSAVDTVRLTTFEALLRFPRPVYLAKMRKLGAVGRKNLQTTTEIDADTMAAVLETGWLSGPG